MIIFLIFTALYNIALNSALNPLMNYLPKSMDAEERRLLEEERAASHGTNEGALEDGRYADEEKEYAQARSKNANGHGTDLQAAPHKKPNMLTKFLRPDKYTDYATMRRLVPKDVEITYSPEEEENAYFHPSITNTTPTLWVPRDPMGVSREECRQTSASIPMTDDGAYLDDKNKIVWDAQDGRPPIYQEKVYY